MSLKWNIGLSQNWVEVYGEMTVLMICDECPSLLAFPSCSQLCGSVDLFCGFSFLFRSPVSLFCSYPVVLPLVLARFLIFVSFLFKKQQKCLSPSLCFSLSLTSAS